MNITSQDYGQHIIGTQQLARKILRDCEGIIVDPLKGNKTSAIFHFFAATYFSLFQNSPLLVLDTVIISGADTLQNYYYICKQWEEQ